MKIKSPPMRQASPLEVQQIPNFVFNKSSQTFTTRELKVLNNGLNFAIDTKPQIEDVVIDVEGAIRHLDSESKEIVRKEVGDILNKRTRSGKTYRYDPIVKKLREKDVFYTKADKGNAVVIIDKNECNSALEEKLKNGNFFKLRNNPLPESIKRVEKALNESRKILGNITDLRMPNPSLPRMRIQPKIQKQGNETREIIADTNSPTYKIAKWLMKEISTNGNYHSKYSVKNSIELVEKPVGHKNLEKSDCLVSFDIKALYPSIPTKEAIWKLEDWLTEQCMEMNGRKKAKVYTKLTALCMNEKYFVCRDQFYKTTSGTAMGNPLSPLISEIFMKSMKKEIEKRGIIPKFWARYIDDILVIIPNEDIEKTLEAINNIYRNITFTMEKEDYQWIAFWT
ncbi:uncharacterized protein LOC119650801 [Hermetia illucens]|uniref:uncharacterized protein LOC119650801 n=1 Tax=Hermetia illucens TaxID=343691 RepID=UPI0018CBF528|nr:uncharacterized protein LOC119650801 [Hermetia illucens]